eukprot:2866405-Rhodomonas_salina.2
MAFRAGLTSDAGSEARTASASAKERGATLSEKAHQAPSDCGNNSTWALNTNPWSQHLDAGQYQKYKKNQVWVGGQSQKRVTKRMRAA